MNGYLHLLLAFCILARIHISIENTSNKSQNKISSLFYVKEKTFYYKFAITEHVWGSIHAMNVV